MRKVTVSKMRERYAQTVLTCRIAYVVFRKECAVFGNFHQYFHNQGIWKNIGSLPPSSKDTFSVLQFYICGSVHHNSRLKKSNKMQQYADIYLLLNYSTCFGRPSRPSSGVHKTVDVASGTVHTIWRASFPDSLIYTRDYNYSFMYS